jgi:hypothetical protein
LHAWRRAHTHALLLGGTGILVLLTTIVAALLVSATVAQPQGVFKLRPNPRQLRFRWATSPSR